MCCTRKNIDDFGIADHSVCKSISVKYPPSNISMVVKTIQQKYNESICYINISCETNESNPPCVIEWSSNIDDLRHIGINNRTYGKHGGHSFVSNAIYIVTHGMAGGTITCSTRCDHFSSELTKNYTVFFSGSQSNEKDIQTSFSTFRFPVNNVLIGAAVFCGLCILFAIGRFIILKGRKDNAVNTIEIVEHHSDTASDNGVLHIETEGVQYAVVPRQASTQRIETQVNAIYSNNHVMTTA
ncbi:uncharacterized protein LOC128233546 [Mya arenaria]|uniref:uncharacterized protein LOC128233546 n=1 Tax=Mya arenaria TaxID=6604 RepID=UPI0022E2D109|nr:uncharacterized protein LOC128233546 [Mya arenaria]